MIGKIIWILIVLLIGVGLLPLVNSQISQIDTTQYSSAVNGMAVLLPLVFAIITIFWVFKSMGVDSSKEQIDWLRYGERLKLAYASKFGGDNRGFDGEVDYHIKIMVSNDKGFTRQLAKDWVKRMSKFVEIEWLKLDDSNDEE